MTFEDWVRSHLSRKERKLKRLKRGYIPVTMRSRQAYTVVFFGLVGLSFTSWVFSHVFVYPEWFSIATINFPMYTVAIVYASFWFTNHLWHNAPKIKPGRLPEYTLVEYNKNRRIEPVLLEDRHKKQHVIIWEMTRGGGLIDGWIDGNGPIFISRSLQKDIEREINEINHTTGVLPTLPEEATKKISSGVWSGKTYIVPGDFHLFLLGNENDGLDPQIRKWIYESYSDLSPLCIIAVAWDTMISEEFVRGMSPSIHKTGYAWELADKDRQINEWKQENQRLRQYIAKGQALEAQYAPFVQYGEQEER